MVSSKEESIMGKEDGVTTRANDDGASGLNSSEQSSSSVVVPEGFVLLGAMGSPAGSESMVLRLGSGRICLGANAWRALGEPKAVHVFGKVGARVLYFSSADSKADHALPCEWSVTHQCAYITNAKWIAAALGLEGQAVVVPVSMDGLLMRVDASLKLVSKGAARGSSKGGARASRGGV
jgi:hypothetical protein